MLYSSYRSFGSFDRISIYNVKEETDEEVYCDAYYFEIGNINTQIELNLNAKFPKKSFYNTEKIKPASLDRLESCIIMVFSPMTIIRENL